MLKVKRLEDGAILPTVAHPGKDLGFDLYALEDVFLQPGVRAFVRTGVSASFHLSHQDARTFGLLLKDRSSIAAKGVTVSAGVIDAGYTGELKVIMTSHAIAFTIKAGDRIAQMLPTEVFTGESIEEVMALEDSARGTGGFGSTGT